MQISCRRHQMGTFSALLAICAGNSPVPGEFPTQRPVTRSFDVFFDLRVNKRLSKQSWGWWYETPSCPLWSHHNVIFFFYLCWDYYISCRSLDVILIFIIFQPWTHLSFVNATWNIWHPERHRIHIWWSHMHLYKAVYHAGNAGGSLTPLNTENLVYH